MIVIRTQGLRKGVPYMMQEKILWYQLIELLHIHFSQFLRLNAKITVAKVGA